MVYRGSRRRVNGIKWREHTRADFLLFVVFALPTIFFVLVWSANRPLPAPHLHRQGIESR
jgi:hypothetical protein